MKPAALRPTDLINILKEATRHSINKYHAETSSQSLSRIIMQISTEYGGLPTEAEWREEGFPIYTIYKDRRHGNLYIGKTCARTPMAFRSKAYARQFLSNDRNQRLVKDYLLM